MEPLRTKTELDGTIGTQTSGHRQRPQIYADACFKRGLAGLAVVGDGWQVAVERIVDTNNEAECLAVLLACEEARKRNIERPIILSDSQLVVNWIKGCYAQRSATAQQYTAEMRHALKEVGGSIQWIPGSKNFADKPSRQVLRVVPFNGTAFEKLKNLPMEMLVRRDFAAVKSGKDSVSAIRKADLIAAALPQDYDSICLAFDKDKYQLSALRWMQRGLPLDKAIRKVEVDREIGHEIAARREARDEWD